MLSRSNRFLCHASRQSLKRVQVSNLLAFSTQELSVKCPFPHETTNKENAPKVPTKVFFTEEDIRQAKPFEQVPGPSALKLLLSTVVPGGQYYKKDFLELNLELQKEYGDLVKMPAMFGRPPMILLFDPAHMEVVLRNEGQWPFRRILETFEIFRRKERPDLFHNMGGLLTDQGAVWQDSRTKVNPIMMQPKTVKQYIPVIDRIAEDFVDRVRSIRDEKNEVPADFRNELNKWALESISYVALNQRLGLLKETDHSSKGQQLIERVHDMMDLTYKLEILPSLWRIYETSNFRRLMDAYHMMTNIITDFINMSIEQFEKNPQPGDEHSVLQRLLKIDKRVAIIMALDMLIAGVDTTSNSALMVIFALAKSPDKQAILREEIMRLLPNDDSKLTAESMKNLPYLRACMKESARLRSIAIGSLRQLPEDVVIGGYRIKKNHDLILAQMTSSMSEKYFKKADQFIPERFLKDEGAANDLKMQHPFSFLPFGFGSRMCIGKRIAEMEIEALVIRIIRNFEIQWNYPDPKMKNEMVTTFDGPLKFTLNDIKRK